MTAETGQPGSLWRKLLDGAVVGLNAIGSLWVFILVLAISADAFGRSFLSAPIHGVVEFVAVSLSVIVFCQLADTIRLGKLTRSDTTLAEMMARRSALGRLVLPAFEFIGALVMAIIIAGTMPILIQSYQRGYYLGTQGIFTFPDWPLKALIVVGAAFAFICFCVRGVHLLRHGRDPVVSRDVE
ncbi:MAG: TRAP transporter small permease subunit [Rhizobiales bacterium]|nr:TRAP transporter small permease subunit [Hyphomicrobiales bacterium]